MDRSSAQLTPSQDPERPVYARVDIGWVLSSRIFHLLVYRPGMKGNVAVCWCGLDFEARHDIAMWDWVSVDYFDPFALRVVEALPGAAGDRSRTLCLNCWRLARAHLTGRGPGSPPLLARTVSVSHTQ